MGPEHEKTEAEPNLEPRTLQSVVVTVVGMGITGDTEGGGAAQHAGQIAEDGRDTEAEPNLEGSRTQHAVTGRC